jgi:hypothetical protein
MILADAAVLVCSSGCAGTVARSKGRPLNVVVRIGVDAVSRMSWRKGKI